METLSKRQRELLEFVGKAHESQQRKYTNEPYTSHLSAVAGMAHRHAIPYGFEIGLCHDLFEDTFIDQPQLYNVLREMGYEFDEANFITMRVFELTDEYTKEKYPDANRRLRKERERERLRQTHEVSQSIKYCDIIDNVTSIVEFDSNFAKVYLPEKDELLHVMDKGNQQLYNKAIQVVFQAKKKLQEKLELQITKL